MRGYCLKSNFKRKEYFKKYRTRNREKRTRYQKLLMDTNVNYKVSSYLRHRLWSAVKSQSTIKTNHTIDLLGCSIDEFKKYLESKFLSGMSWDNYGKWHIDHIRACATFNLSLPSEQGACFHYTNMQPLWAIDNFRKWISPSSPSAEQNTCSLQMVPEN
jgi:hypothetical protein